MFTVKTLNHISPACRKILESGYTLSDNAANPDAIFVRATDMHQYEFNKELCCIARAGIGINNIPVERCTDEGIVVFNTPGGNANGVKELFLFALNMASRDLLPAINWVYGYDNPDVPVEVAMEKIKKEFAGPEFGGKTIGVIGTGNVGSLVANICVDLGMRVLAYDPFLSVDAAWKISRYVERAPSLDMIYKECDYITLHAPLTEETRNMVNADSISKMRDGVRIINLARGGCVNEDDIISALESGKVARFVADFPTERLIKAKNCILTPHLGGTTVESEEKCAVMAAEQMADYLENGNIKNSVNLPTVFLERMGVCRLCVIHRNVPRMINRFLDLVGDKNINVEHMINKPCGGVAYTIIDVGEHIGDDVAEKIASMAEVMRVRVI